MQGGGIETEENITIRKEELLKKMRNNGNTCSDIYLSRTQLIKFKSYLPQVMTIVLHPEIRRPLCCENDYTFAVRFISP